MASVNRVGNGKIKLSPKLASLLKWEKISFANEMLDSGETPNAVAKWINKNGFKISLPLVYDYAKIRQQCVLNGMSMDTMLGVSQNATVKQGDKFNSKKEKLKNELDALNKIIEIGYNSLDHYVDKPMPVSILMQAIKLKNELTDGYFGGLTEYGLQQLTLLEKQKYDMLVEVLMKYIPDNKKEDATNEMAVAEENFYKHSEYYDEYLRASGLTEREISIKLKQRDEELAEENDNVIEV